jgi:hypothetical protein
VLSEEGDVSNELWGNFGRREKLKALNAEALRKIGEECGDTSARAENL